MILISHRGNINGRHPVRENNPDYIQEALKGGYDVEIDVWCQDRGFALGHDEPQYAVEEAFLENDKLWCHAKNFKALGRMLDNKQIHCFWQQGDDFSLTSKNIIWTNISKELGPQSICVLPELRGITDKKSLPKCLGVCSDYISKFI